MVRGRSVDQLTVHIVCYVNFLFNKVYQEAIPVAPQKSEYIARSGENVALGSDISINVYRFCVGRDVSIAFFPVMKHDEIK